MATKRRSKARSFAPGALVALVVALGLAIAPAIGAAADVTPFVPSLPTVTGPIASTSTDFPFIADGFDVFPPAPKGYVEDEFFFSGTGNLYEYTSTGIEVVTPCPASVSEGSGCMGIPYETRMLVKRPANPAQFSGTVTGTVTDPSGAVLPNATIKLTSDATGQATTAKTNAEGSFTFPSLAPGSYHLDCTATGFAEVTLPVTLQTNQVLNVPVQVAVRSSVQTVQVTTQSPLLDTADDRIQETIPASTASSG